MNTPLVYVITHAGYGSVKVGCSSERATRLSSFGKAGWVTFRKLFVPTASDAYEIEQSALLDLRSRLYAPAHLTAQQLPGGWTETVSASLAPAPVVWDIVCGEAGRLVLGGSDRRAKRARTLNRPQRTVKPLTEEDLAAVRAHADHLARSGQIISTRIVSELLGGGEKSYISVLTRTVKEERGEADDIRRVKIGKRGEQ